ncbi:MAG TPA: hypothetical protein VIE15_04640 [Acidimicrobiales bacterium]
MPPAIDLNSITCVTTEACVAITYDGASTVITSDGWTTWTRHVVPDQLTLFGASCVSAQFCSASGTDSTQTPWFLSSVDGGATWSVLAVPLDVDGFYQGYGFTAPITCLNRLTCLLAGESERTGANGQSQWFETIFRTADGGHAWRDTPLPSVLTSLVGLTCRSHYCFAAGGTGDFLSTATMVFGSVTGGATWTTKLVSSAMNTPEGIACPTARVCDVIGSTATYALDVVRTVTAGRSWTRRAVTALGAGSVYGGGITCASVQTCVLSGGVASAPVVVTTDSGTTWVPSDVQVYAPSLRDVACPSVGTCEAVGGSRSLGGGAGIAERTTDDGKTWTVQQLPTGFAAYRITCPTVTTCFALGFDSSVSGSVMARTTDGGATWAVLPVPVHFFFGISCPTVADCVGTSFGSVSYTTNGGATWTDGVLPALPDGDFYELSDVTCPTAARCYATGVVNTGPASIVATFLTSTDGGATWSDVTLPGQGAFASTDSPGPISCSSSTTCVSVGVSSDPSAQLSGSSVAVFVTTDGGGTWTQVDAIGGSIDSVSSVQCTAGNWCEMVGQDSTHGRSYAFTSTDGGTHWTAAAMPATWRSSTSVACAAMSSCLSVGDLTDGGLGVAVLA